MFVMRLEKQISGMNLQMSISVKVNDTMTKTDLSINWSNVCKVSLFFKNLTTDHKSQNCSVKYFSDSHLRDHLRFRLFRSRSFMNIYIWASSRENLSSGFRQSEIQTSFFSYRDNLEN